MIKQLKILIQQIERFIMFVKICDVCGKQIKEETHVVLDIRHKVIGEYYDKDYTYTGIDVCTECCIKHSISEILTKQEIK